MGGYAFKGKMLLMLFGGVAFGLGLLGLTYPEFHIAFPDVCMVPIGALVFYIGFKMD